MDNGLPKLVGKPLRAAAERCAAGAATIRGKILFAFVCFAAITGFLGAVGLSNVDGAGRLAVMIYDKPLMSISYARLALSNFVAMELAWTQRQATTDPVRRSASDARIDELERAIAEDLAVAESRSVSGRAAESAREARRAIGVWHALRTSMPAGASERRSLAELERQSAVVLTIFDNLVELTAEDGFKSRERALSSVQSFHQLTIACTLLALFLGAAVTLLLAHQMVRPIGAASRAASRIAAGELDVDIEAEGNDELGHLLRSMIQMRDNIRTMIARETAARHSAQMRLVKAIESSSEAVILIDGDNRVLISNAQAAEFFPGFVDGLASGAIMPEALGQILTQPGYEIELTPGQWLRLSHSKVADGSTVMIASDITVFKERESVLREAKENAEAASRAKTEFLANMSHELRTPLNAIIGFAQIIRDGLMGSISERYKDYGKDIDEAGRHLLSLINDVLDISKIEVGRLDLYEEIVDIHSIFMACNNMTSARARGARLELIVTEPSDLPMVQADERRLKQILFNLLSNAIKFTPAGGKIILSAARTDAGNIEIAVSDTGIGMRPEDVARALEPFQQIDGALNRRYQGAGLGLPIARRLTELHGGVLTIVTAPQRGTTVTVVLPRKRCIRDVA